MAQSGGTTRRKTWQVWAQVWAAVFFCAGAVLALTSGGNYWYALFQLCGAGIMVSLALRADERGGGWTVLLVVLGVVGLLAIAADIAL